MEADARGRLTRGEITFQQWLEVKKAEEARILDKLLADGILMPEQHAQASGASAPPPTLQEAQAPSPQPPQKRDDAVASQSRDSPDLEDKGGSSGGHRLSFYLQSPSSDGLGLSDSDDDAVSHPTAAGLGQPGASLGSTHDPQGTGLLLKQQGDTIEVLLTATEVVELCICTAFVHPLKALP